MARLIDALKARFGLRKKRIEEKEHFALLPCPYCGGEPRLIRCGDQKEYLVYQCSKCHKTPVKSCEARITEYGARKIWNRRAGCEQH